MHDESPPPLSCRSFALVFLVMGIPKVIPLEIPLLHSPNLRYLWGVNAISIIWDGMYISTCYLSLTLSSYMGDFFWMCYPDRPHKAWKLAFSCCYHLHISWAVLWWLILQELPSLTMFWDMQLHSLSPHNTESRNPLTQEKDPACRLISMRRERII